MANQPVGDIMETAMGKIRELVDSNTVVGQPITTPDGVTVIPVSRVSFGFGSGGSDKSPAAKPGYTALQPGTHRPHRSAHATPPRPRPL